MPLVEKKEIGNISSKEFQWIKYKDLLKKWKTLGIHDDIVLNNYVHSHEWKKCKRSPEAYIAHHCDIINFQIRKTMGK